MKQYKHYTTKEFEALDENGKTLMSIRADQEAERLLGMRPDLARGQYCMLLAKVLEDKASALVRRLSSKKNEDKPSPSDSIWGDA